MFHNFFGQHGKRSLIWQLDYHPQDQFSVPAQGPTLQYSLLDGDSDLRRLLFPLLAHAHCFFRPSPHAMRRALWPSSRAQSFSIELQGFARRGWLLWRPRIGQRTVASGLSRYPEISMQAVRRDIEERRKQIHAVILVHMQFIKQLTVIKPLVYCSAILIPVKWFILWIISARFPHDEQCRSCAVGLS